MPRTFKRTHAMAYADALERLQAAEGELRVAREQLKSVDLRKVSDGEVRDGLKSIRDGLGEAHDWITEGIAEVSYALQHDVPVAPATKAG